MYVCMYVCMYNNSARSGKARKYCIYIYTVDICIL